MKTQQVPHIINDENGMTNSAMIPFCEFGGNMYVMGIKMDQFDVPVCNSFRPIIVLDQLCYQVDPNEYIINNKINNKIVLEGDNISLSLFIHYNEDRQIEDFDDSEDLFITLDTISNIFSTDNNSLITDILQNH